MNSQKAQFAEWCRGESGKPYLWGGSGPDGYDCSGFIIAGLQYSGVGITDHTAHQIYCIFGNNQVDISDAEPGDIVFYGSPERVHHCMVVAQRWSSGHITLVGARGGNSTTTTVDAAREMRAMVDIVDGTYWASERLCFVDPWK